MRYRPFGNLGFDVSVLGFGCMRLPVLEGSSGEYASMIDEEQTIQMVHYAIEHGINYFDTAYKYNDGKSEILLGKALEGGYREKVKIATKLPAYLAKNRDDLDRMLEDQMERLQVDCIDLYLLHNLSHMTWDLSKERGALDFLDQARKRGLIKHVGFSFHDGFHLFEEIIGSYDWDFCQIQLNYLDEYYQAGIEGLRFATEKGLAVVVMEPLRGGNLVKIVPDEARLVWDQAPIKRSPADWAFRWVANFPEVSTILSGMSNMEQLIENVNIFNDFTPNSLHEDEMQLINEVKEIYKNRIKINCTQCSYCMPCPNGVYIRGIFNFYNEASLFNKQEDALCFYKRMKTARADGSACIKCGRCEMLCPQHLPIMNLLEEVDREWSKQLKMTNPD